MATRRGTPTDSRNAQQTLERIRQRAYELFEERGRQDGFADQDWYQAEAEVLGKSFKAAA